MLDEEAPGCGARVSGGPQANASVIRNARIAFHNEIIAGTLLSLTGGIPSNADKDSAFSVAVAKAILNQLPPGVQTIAKRLPGQTAGALFERATRNYVEATFSALTHLRPGTWAFPASQKEIARYEQYAHLNEIEQLVVANPELAIAMGRNYVIEPDVVIVRYPEPDAVINANQTVVDETFARRTGLRAINNVTPFLHASISCKWTLRNDRAQNARSEALILVRNRKGRLPHTVALTAEPFPPRLASLALGTGDLDCVYHFALPELMNAVAGNEVAENLVRVMVEGKRLKDISDLPLDLAV
jgi:hypothetical protein